MENTYTIREIALAIGYTKPSVSNAIKELGITPAKNGNTNILTQEQAEQIANHFGKTLDSKDVTSKSKDETEIERQHQQYVSLLESQLKAKDEQIKSLQETMAGLQSTVTGLQETIDNLISTNRALSASVAVKDAQQMLEAKPIQEKEEQPQEPKKKGFWARLFG